MSEHDGFAQEFYWRMREAVTGRLTRDQKRIREKKKKGGSKTFEKGRDPHTIGGTLEGLFSDFNWTEEITQAELFANWATVVGEATAAKSKPEELQNGVLTVRCESTAWATQLKLMQSEILTKIQDQFSSLGVVEIKVFGPAGPSFKRGLRSVPGRGVRDTYG